MFKPTNLNLNFPIVVADSTAEVFPELVKCATINSDQAVGKMPLTFLILKTEVQYTELTVNLTNTFPRNKNKKTKKQKSDEESGK